MVLPNLIKPKWQHRNPEVRLNAIKAMADPETDILVSIALNDEDPQVREAAIEKIAEPAALKEIIDKAANTVVKRQALEKRDTLLVREILNGKEAEHRGLIGEIDDQESLATIVLQAQEVAIRLHALERITDQRLLTRVVEQECGKAVAEEALERIHDQSLLEKIASHGANKTARRLAADKLGLNEPRDASESEQEMRDQRLAELADLAVKLKDSLNWDLAAERFKELEKEWKHLDPSGNHPNRECFVLARKHFEERFQGHEKQVEQERRYQEEQLRLARQCEDCLRRVDEMIQSPANVKDDALSSLDDQWREASGKISREENEPLFSRFNRSRYELAGILDVLHAERQELQTLYEQIDKIRANLVGDPDEAVRLYDAFHGMMTALSFKHADTSTLEELKKQADREVDGCRKELEARKEKAREENMKARLTICEQLEALIEAEDHLVAEQAVKDLQNSWDSIEKIPGEDFQQIEERHSTSLTRFFDKQREFFSVQDWQRWANKTQKEELIQSVEALDGEEDLERIAEVVKEAQSKWKSIGPVPKEEAQALWERFHRGCEYHFNRCKPYFEELEKRRQEVSERKEKLCAMAEELTESDHWKETAEKLKTLQNEWNDLGPLASKVEQSLFARFRKACNKFFERRRLHLEELERHRQEHSVIKEELCVKVEALVSSPDWRHGKTIRELQQQWKETGTAPRDRETELWKRFRGACDAYYAWLDEQREKNLRRKEELCQELEQLLADVDEQTNMRQIALKISELQQQWKEIGPVPKDQKDVIWNRFREKCDSFFHNRREHFQKLTKEREQNLARMKDILAQAEECIKGSDHRAISENLRGLQEQWKEIGPGPRAEDREMRRRFSELCNSYFEDRRTFFEESSKARLDNLRKKESLCFQLEKLLCLGTDGERASMRQQSTALSLAEQLKIAMETNTILGTQVNDRKVIRDEVRRIQQEWKSIGPVPREHDKALYRRYRDALDQYFAQDKTRGK